MSARLLRLAATCFALTALSGLTVGCGAGSLSAHSATVGLSRPITKAQATAYARAVNLRAGNLPLGSVLNPEGEEPKPSGREATCTGEMDPDRRIINRHSATLGWTLPGEFEQIHSAVEVLPTAALMTKHNAANRSRHSLHCVSLYFSRAAREHTGRVEFGAVKVTRLPDPLPGIAGGFEYRVVSTVTKGNATPSEMADYTIGRPKQLHLYMDIFGFISGPAEINLVAMGIPRPVAKSEEDRLLLLLYDATKAHRL